MTYTVLNTGVTFTVAAIAVALSRHSWRTMLLVFLILGSLTVVFDSLMITAELFRYPPENLSGLRVWRAPIEDLAWPAVAAMLVPALRDRLADPTRTAGDIHD